MTEAQLVKGAGNLFVLFDARAGAAPSGEDAAAWCEAARELAGRRADGLLVLHEGEVGTQLSVWNADGSLAAACGNGLRCAGWLLLLEGGAEEVLIQAETGPRWVRGVAGERGSERLTADLGVVQVEPMAEALPLMDGEEAAWRGDAGNPHCVFLVEDVDQGSFRERGAALQEHPLFSGGVNVGYVAPDADGWRLRVYERGVGETESCGTGAAAAAHVLHEALGCPFPVSLRLAGGELEIDQDASGGARLTGPVELLGQVSLEPAASAPPSPLL